MLKLSTECDAGSSLILEEKRREIKKPVFPEFKVKVPKFFFIDTIRLVWWVLTAKVVYQVHKQQHGFQIQTADMQTVLVSF